MPRTNVVGRGISTTKDKLLTQYSFSWEMLYSSAARRWSFALRDLVDAIANDRTNAHNLLTAISIWKDFFDKHPNATADEIYNWVRLHKTQFERDCGGKHAGQRAMVWSAFGELNARDPGLMNSKNLADSLVQAFARETTETKSPAREAAAAYLPRSLP